MAAPNPHPTQGTVPLKEPSQQAKCDVRGILGNDADALASMFSSAVQGPAQIECGCVFAEYLLIEKIADGGFGSVWLAEQREPLVREVALKLIRPDRASAEVISRFERERQALAMMDHENIAKVFDAGEQEGQLFFAMEYVPGKPITQHVKEHALSLRQRVELFIPICRAVHHAHVKQVLHRDLKPSNILIAINNGKATPKVIDFGIAKALSDDHAMLRADTGAFPVTQHGFVIGTPQYMSPEQARGSADIDAASDIFTLGTILYELLVGEPPVSASQLADKCDPFALLEFIIHHEPALPSALWIQESTRRTPALDATMGQDPRRISRQIREDLDWIIMHALEKDRSRRYSSADALADDLQRYLAHEPVSVGPPSAGYRLRKFFQRNKASSIAAMLVLTSVLAGGGVATWQWHEAFVAKELEATARHNAEAARNAETIAREHAEASQRVAETREQEAKQARDEEAKARLLAEDRRRQADAAREQEARARHASDLARTEAEDLINFMLYDMRDRLEPLNRTPLLATVAQKAESYFSAQASTLQDTPAQARNRAAMHQNKGLIELAQGKTSSALASFTSFLSIAQELATKEPGNPSAQSDLALAHNRLGMVHQAAGDLTAARREYQQEQDIVIQLLKAKPRATTWRLHLATTHEHLGDVGNDDALAHYEKGYGLLSDLHAEEPQSIEVKRKLATAHEKIGIALRATQPVAALKHFDDQLALLSGLPAGLADDARIRRERVVALQNKGGALLTSGRAADALPALEEAVNASRALAEADPGNAQHQSTLASALDLLGTCHAELGRLALRTGSPAGIRDCVAHLTSAREALAKSIAAMAEEAPARRAKLQQVNEAMTEALRLSR